MAEANPVEIIIKKMFNPEKYNYYVNCSICNYGSCSCKLPVCEDCKFEYENMYRILRKISSDMSKIEKIIISEIKKNMYY